jgi:glycerophosphoryl diester phosphodiesterase family protein
MAAISAHAPRAGTIEAYARALETGAEYVEFDIRRTADGELAAFHDARTRQGEALAAISYARLCQLAGYEVPRVADVMALIAGKAAADPRVAVLITNRPADAVALRASLTPAALTPVVPQAP